MQPKNIRTRAQTFTIFSVLCLIAIPVAAVTSLPQAHAQEPTILVTGYTGTSVNYTISQLQAMPNITMYGGFYQQNQAKVNSGLWTGVDLLYLCNQVDGITSTCNITVTGQGANIFTYNMVQNGLDLNLGYRTYNNLTGAQQNQTERVYVILAYKVNGTDLPVAEQPAPRLIIVGAEGLVIAGSGGRGVTQVNVTKSQPAPTPTPSPEPTTTPVPTTTPTIAPTPTQTPVPPSPTITPSTAPIPSAIPTATPALTNSPSPSPSQQPTISPSSTPELETNQLANTYTITAIVAGLAIIIIVAAVIILKRK